MSQSEDSQKKLKSANNTSFAELLDNVKPLHKDHKNRTSSHAPKPKPTPHQKIKDEKRVLEESLKLEVSLDVEDVQTGDSLSYCGPGIQNSVFRKLKKGHYIIGDELDLHGHTRPEAQVALSKFIQISREKNIRCVRIIHGKGRGSSNQGPKLKPMVNKWLQQRKEILAFCSAKPSDGGTGAVYVLLKALR